MESILPFRGCTWGVAGGSQEGVGAAPELGGVLGELESCTHMPVSAEIF